MVIKRGVNLREWKRKKDTYKSKLIEFSKWTKWTDRDALQDLNLQGIYILAKFITTPRGKVNPLDNAIVYVGETCRQSLRKRCYDFNRAAFSGKGRHSGGKRYNEEYHDKGRNLYVSVFPIEARSHASASPFIRYIERKLIYEYALKHGGSLPFLNHE